MIYILDTCAIRSLGRAYLAGISRSVDLRVGPISFLECLCHLDELRDGLNAVESFRLAKGELTRYRLLQFLEDPFAFHAIEIGREDIVNETRLEDSDLYPSILPLLESANSIEEFHATRLVDQQGRQRNLNQIAQRAKEVLRGFEGRFKESVQLFREGFIEDLGPERAAHLTIEDCMMCVHQTVDRLNQEYGNPTQLQRAMILSSQFVHLAFLYIHVMECIQNFGLEHDLSFDPNDAEDATLCFYLSLVDERTLVTGDTRIHRRITAALNWIRENFPQTPVRCRVLNLEEFRAEINP